MCVCRVCCVCCVHVCACRVCVCVCVSCVMRRVSCVVCCVCLFVCVSCVMCRVSCVCVCLNIYLRSRLKSGPIIACDLLWVVCVYVCACARVRRCAFVYLCSYSSFASPCLTLMFQTTCSKGGCLCACAYAIVSLSMLMHCLRGCKTLAFCVLQGGACVRVYVFVHVLVH